MANTHAYHHHQPRKPRRVRAPSQRAQGLDPELTAQPRVLPDDIDLSSDPADLSIEPEDLASHFLSEAVDQGDLGSLRAAEVEIALQSDTGEAPIIESDLDEWEEDPRTHN